MDDKLYRIEFDGELSEGATEEDARIHLRKKFKLDNNKIDRMFSGEPLILKKNIPREDAEKYKKAFLNIGLVCTIHLLVKVPEALPENFKPPVEQEVQSENISIPVMSVRESKEDEKSLLNVREVLGFTGKGLKSPESEIEIYESLPQKSPAEAVVPDSRELVDTTYSEIAPDSEFLNIDENPDPPVEMIAGVEGGNISSSQFLIIFSGKIGDGQTTEKVKEALSELFGIEDQDVDILFSNMPVVLKENVEESRAIQYREQFHTIGAEVELVKIEDHVEGIEWE